jgi:hypothetical protein
MPGRTFRSNGHDQNFLWPPSVLVAGASRSTMKDAAKYDAQPSDALGHPCAAGRPAGCGKTIVTR